MKKETIKEILIYAGLIVFVVLLRTFVITPVRVNMSSMYPTLKEKDIMILNKVKYVFSDIKRFDIVVVTTDDEPLIKRVIGLPGEKLEFIDGVLLIDGKEVKEPYLKQVTKDFNINELNYLEIPDDCYFLIGDNRSVSIDSRVLGCFNKEDIKGSANLVIWPFKNIGFKK